HAAVELDSLAGKALRRQSEPRDPFRRPGSRVSEVVNREERRASLRRQRGKAQVGGCETRLTIVAEENFGAPAEQARSTGEYCGNLREETGMQGDIRPVHTRLAVAGPAGARVRG